MKIPNAENCVIDKSKIEDYLLSFIHVNGKYKAKYFYNYGFNLENSFEMIFALKRHLLQCEVVSIVKNDFGMKYILEGILETPDKRNPEIRSVWIIENNENIPKFVTAYPI